MNKPHHDIDRYLYEPVRAAAFRRSVMDPEEYDAHMVKPQHVGQLSAQVFVHARVRAIYNLSEQADALFAHGGGFGAKTIEMAFRIGCRCKRHPRKRMVRLNRSDLSAHHFEKPRLEVALRPEHVSAL